MSVRMDITFIISWITHQMNTSSTANLNLDTFYIASYQTTFFTFYRTHIRHEWLVFLAFAKHAGWIYYGQDDVEDNFCTWNMIIRHNNKIA